MLRHTRMKKCKVGVYLSIKEELSGVMASKKKKEEQKVKNSVQVFRSSYQKYL